MEMGDGKRAVSLGIRVGTVFLITVVTVILVAYMVLTRNTQGLLVDYSVRLIESMAGQGVTMVEMELDKSRREIAFLADSFSAPESAETVKFPRPYSKDGVSRMVYISETEIFTSDGASPDVRSRQDIVEAFAGKVAVYGPYFNEQREYVICYSAPVREGDAVVGVLSMEKNGYRFCEIIKDIRFANSGESYIINREGTDIAVSDRNHIDWVNTQYNAQQLYEKSLDEETRIIMELERKGLNGETGVGTYYWKDGLCYVFYQPIPSEGWVLLAGIREEELTAMTRSSMFVAVSDGPVLGGCLILVLFLTALIVYWIISSMKKDAEVNEKLSVIANYDALTGLLNRNSYHAMLDTIEEDTASPLSCVYLDVNGLHELNNHLGHQAGDRMLQAVADALSNAFLQDKIYRIGGDEFVVVCREKSEQEIRRRVEKARKSLRGENYEVSIGIAAHKENSSVLSMVNEAEAAMLQDKRRYYEENASKRNMRILNKRMTQMIVEKQDADTFLSVLAPKYKGVYFVNLSNDTVRHIFIPPYFEECLKETKDRFSKALILYAKRNVRPEYHEGFREICDYARLEEKLDSSSSPELVYQKLNGEWLKLEVLKFRDYSSEDQETLWIFANTHPSEKD